MQLDLTICSRNLEHVAAHFTAIFAAFFQKWRHSFQISHWAIPFYSIQGDGSKILGGPSKEISGGSKILKYAYLGGKNILTNILWG